MIATGAIVALVVLVFGRLAYGLILPFMRADLNLDYQQAGNLGTATALGYLCLITLSGMMAVRRGQLTILTGMLMITLGFIGLSLSTGYPYLLACMVLLGFGTAFSYTPTISLLVGWFPEKRATVIGAVNSGAGIGLLVAGALVPYLNSSFGASGWRISWGAFAVAGLMTAAAVYRFLPDPPAHGAQGDTARSDISRAVYRNPLVIRTGVIYAIVGSTYVVQAIFMYSFALHAGISAQTAGQLAAMSGILSIFSGPAGGWLADRFGLWKVIQALIVADLIATILPVLWPTLAGFAIHYAVIGMAMSALFSVVLASTTTAVSAHESPIAISYVTLFYAVAQLICPALAGLIVERAGRFSAAFAASGLLIAFGFVLSLRTRKLASD